MCGEPSLIKRSQCLRRGMTDAKRALWRELHCDQLGRRLRRQHPIPPYIVDFACIDAKNSLSRWTADNTQTFGIKSATRTYNGEVHATL